MINDSKKRLISKLTNLFHWCCNQLKKSIKFLVATSLGFYKDSDWDQRVLCTHQVILEQKDFDHEYQLHASTSLT